MIGSRGFWIVEPPRAWWRPDRRALATENRRVGPGLQRRADLSPPHNARSPPG
jgi:hypothetical protein